MYQILIGIGLVIIIFVLIVIINIRQNGTIVSDPSVLPDFTSKFGKPANELTFADLQKMKKSELMYVFQKSSLPDSNAINGEYYAENTKHGILTPIVQFFTDHLFGPGKWVGKSFDMKSMTGMNVFRASSKSEHARRFELVVKRSRYDLGEALHLIYKRYNRSLFVHSMHDEVRQINDKLFIGLGTTVWGFGKRNPSPFFLGPKTQ